MHQKLRVAIKQQKRDELQASNALADLFVCLI
jgi:hypothetical protein